MQLSHNLQYAMIVDHRYFFGRHANMTPWFRRLLGNVIESTVASIFTLKNRAVQLAVITFFSKFYFILFFGKDLFWNNKPQVWE